MGMPPPGMMARPGMPPPPGVSCQRVQPGFDSAAAIMELAVQGEACVHYACHALLC
jgi:hypothetical protein